MENQQWKKVVYSESDGQVNVKQGFFSDEGDFVRVVGDHSEALIRKDKIVSITCKLEEQDGTRTK